MADNDNGKRSGSLSGIHLWEIVAVRDVVLIGVVLFLLWFGYYLRSIFTPVLIALALAYLFDPPITYCERRWRMARPVTILVLIGGLVVVGTGLVIWVGGEVVSQVNNLIANLGEYKAALLNMTRSYVDIGEVDKQISDFVAMVKEDPMSMLGTVLSGTSSAGGMIYSVVGKTTYVVVTLALTPFYFFFFAWRFDSMVCLTRELLPASRKDRILEVAEKMNEAVSGFVRGRIIIAIMMGVMFSAGWWLAGVPYWLLLGMGTGLLSLIPYAGVVGWPLAVILKYLDMRNGADIYGFDWMMVAFWPSMVYLVVQFIEGWVLTPWIQGKSTNMSTVTILILVFVGGTVGGLYGLILCVPLGACVKILLVDVVLPSLRKWSSEN